MKTLTLTTDERSLLIEALASIDERGAFSIEVELASCTVCLDGSLHWDGYREDDRENGTGAFIETDRHGFIYLSAYDEDGNEYAIDYDTYNECYEYLNTVQ